MCKQLEKSYSLHRAILRLASIISGSALEALQYFEQLHNTILVQFEFHAFRWIQVQFLMIVKLSIQEGGPDIYLAHFSSRLDEYSYTKSNCGKVNY